MKSNLKKFTFFCTEDRLHRAICTMKSIEGVRLLHAFEKEFKLMIDKKNRARRVRRHLVAGVCPEQKMTDVLRLLAMNRIYGFNHVTQVQFSDLLLPIPLQV